jgi:AcrR family transcriptional regulator
VDSLSIADVADRAGVHEVSTYRRWATRANLALDAVLAEIGTVVPEPDTGTLHGDLLALLHDIREVITSPLGQVLLQLAARADLGDYEPARAAFWAARLAVADRILDRAAARGELRSGIDRHVAVETLIAPLSLRTAHPRTARRRPHRNAREPRHQRNRAAPVPAVTTHTPARHGILIALVAECALTVLLARVSQSTP